MDVPWYSYNDLARAADAFLEQQHPSRNAPVPIEEIVELGMRLDIVPIPNLQADFDTVGFTSSDLSAICVDATRSGRRDTALRWRTRWAISCSTQTSTEA